MRKSRTIIESIRVKFLNIVTPVDFSQTCAAKKSSIADSLNSRAYMYTGQCRTFLEGIVANRLYSVSDASSGQCGTTGERTAS